MKQTSILLLLTLLILSGCSKAPGKTEAKFKIGLAAISGISSYSAGGAMLWGKADNGESFGSVISTSVPFEMVLGNGSWTFWAVSWQGNGTSKNLVGMVRCAKTVANLSGTDVQVNINLTNATCAIPDFSPTVNVSSGIYNFPKISMYECNQLSDHKGRGCGQFPKTKSIRKRFYLNGFHKPKDGPLVLNGQRLISECMASNQTLTSEQFPTGNGIVPIHTALESFFTSTTCDDNDPKGSVVVNYENGIYATPRSDTLKFVSEGSCNTSGISQAQCLELGGSWSSSCSLPAGAAFDISKSKCDEMLKVYTNTAIDKRIGFITTIPDSVLCSGPRIDPGAVFPHVFASGNGTTANPYTVCREYQLNKIGEMGAANFNFSLHTNLNMDATSAFGTQPRPACFNNDPGANFVPFASDFDGSCNQINPTSHSFSGTFDGNNYTISNIRLNHSNSVDYMGFARKSSGVLKNFTLKNIEVEGNSHVGAVVGSTTGQISGITVIEADISGNDRVGGVVGTYGSNLNFTKNKVIDSEVMVEMSASYAGGLIGYSSVNNLTIESSSFEGLIKTNSSTESLGGLLGKQGLTGSLTINDSYSSGVILSSGTGGAYAAGLVASVMSASTIVINQSYSKMSIGPSSYKNTFGSARLGGLLANQSTSTTINDSYYYGSIMHPCLDTSSSYCTVNTISVASGGTYTRTFGRLLYPAWYTTAPSEQATAAIIEGTTYKNELLSSGQYVDVGSKLLRLKSESGLCVQTNNNATVASQVIAGRGTVSNPIVLCNKEQWSEINTYNNKHYVLGDNIVLGELFASPITNFSGSIDGKGKILSGFYVWNSAGHSALFSQVAGKISNVKFAAGYIYGGSLSSDIGVVALVNTGGVIEKSSFDSVNLLAQGDTVSHSGVVAAINGGIIRHVSVNAHSSTQTPYSGLVAGKNIGAAVIYGVRAEGEVAINNSSRTMYVGGVVGENAAAIREVDTSVEVINDVTNGNNNSASRIGAFAGNQMTVIEDVLIRPYARMKIEKAAPRVGHIFGYTGSGSISKRIVAANELPLQGNTYVNVYHTSGENVAGATLQRINTLHNAVFAYDPTAYPPTTTTCSGTAGSYSYYLSGSFTIGSYSQGFYFPNYNLNNSISARITGVYDGSTTINANSSQFTIPCDAGSGYQSGWNIHGVSNYGNFALATTMLPEEFKNINFFCPSGAGYSTDQDYTCPSGEYDVAGDLPNTRGYNRLINAYATWLSTGEPPTAGTYPKWTMGDGDYPKLFIVD